LTATPCKSRLLIAGLGNSTRKDDAIGIRLVEAIGPDLPAVIETVIWEGADAFAIAQSLLECDRPVLFVDGAELGRKPGTSHWWSESEAQWRARERERSTHGFRLHEGIDLARSLGFDREIRFFGVQPADIDLGHELSPQLQTALPKLQQDLLDVIAALLVSVGCE